MALKKASKSIPDWPVRDGYKLRIHWDDTDCTKRVYLGKYIKWIDDACTEYLRERGLVFSPEGWLSLNGKELDEGFVVGEYTCRIEQTSDFEVCGDGVGFLWSSFGEEDVHVGFSFC